MSKPDASARAGEDLSPAEDLKSALGDFVSEFKSFSTGIDAKLQKQEERMNKLDRKSAGLSRPMLSTAAETEAPHQKAFAAYLRSGDDDALRGLSLEGKAMSSSVSAEGGYLIDPQTADTIKSVLRSNASVRAIANVVTVDAASFDVLIDHTEMGAGWASESGAAAETDTPQIDRITIPLHELSAMPKATQRLLDDSAFDIEGWLAGRIAAKFARSEAASFVSGDGVDKPKGFLSYPKVDNDVWAWGNIGYVVTGASGSIVDGDPVIELVYALGAEYRAGASFVMNSKTAGTIRKLKDAGVVCMPTVGLPKHAIKAVELGADVVTVQGGEGGGIDQHLHRALGDLGIDADALDLGDRLLRTRPDRELRRREAVRSRRLPDLVPRDAPPRRLRRPRPVRDAAVAQPPQRGAPARRLPARFQRRRKHVPPPPSPRCTPVNPESVRTQEAIRGRNVSGSTIIEQR